MNDGPFNDGEADISTVAKDVDRKQNGILGANSVVSGESIRGQKFDLASTKKHLQTVRDQLQTDLAQVTENAHEGNILAKHVIREAIESQKPETIRVTDEEYFQVGMPFYKKTFRNQNPWDSEPGPPREVSVYAEFTSKIRSQVHSAALVRKDLPDIPFDRQPNAFYLVPYIESKETGERIYPQYPKRVAEGDWHHAWNVKITNIGGQIFNVENSPIYDTDESELEAAVPNQQGKQSKLDGLVTLDNPIAKELQRRRRAKETGMPPALHAEPVKWDEKRDKEVIDAAVERFPDDVDFALKVHRGGYDADETYMTAIKDQIKGSWQVFAEELGLDSRDFPMETVHLWAPPLGDTSHVPFLNRVRNAIHKRRPKIRYFDTSRISINEGVYTPPFLGIKERLDIPVSETGVIDFGKTAHELFHAYLHHRDIHIPTRTTGHHGVVFDEGLATVADKIVMNEALSKGRVKIIGNQYLEQDFDSLIAVSQEGEADDVNTRGSINHNGHIYSFANSVLHLYLLKERGGFDKMRELTKQDTKRRDALLKAYEHTYGESLPELVKKAKDWFDVRPQLATTRVV